MKKKQFTTLIISLTFITLFLPTSSAQAQELPFGGIVSFPISCTCSGMLWIWFTPLYLGGLTVVTGPMIYSPFTTTPYANFRIGVPLTWHLGSYIPGVQACWIFVGWGCVPLPAIALMTKVGTN